MDATLLVNELTRLGAIPNPPATPTLIGLVEKRLSIQLPPGLPDFYRACNGLAEPTTEWSWFFFPLESITRLSEYRDHAYDVIKLDDGGMSVEAESLVIFCDVLIDAPTYAYCADTKSSSYGHFFADQSGHGWRVATSFADFVDIFLAQNKDNLLNSPLAGASPVNLTHNSPGGRNWLPVEVF